MKITRTILAVAFAAASLVCTRCFAAITPKTLTAELTDAGSVKLSWQIEGNASSGWFPMYQNGSYNVAILRGESSDQPASSREIIAGNSAAAYMLQTGTTGSVVDSPEILGKTYFYWLHYSPVSLIDDPPQFFVCYQGGGYDTIRSADSYGPVAIFVPDVSTLVHVTFNPNGAKGDAYSQEFEKNVEEELEKNKFERPGFDFKGWATAPDGGIVYSDCQKITISEDLDLFAVWEQKPLVLIAISADWGKGSITFSCDDGSGETSECKYTLTYYDEAASDWVDVEGAIGISPGSDGKALLDDPQYLLRNGALPPVRYRAKDETGRFSNELEMRHRNALVVAVGHYEETHKEAHGIEDLPEVAGYGTRFHEAAETKGKFNSTLLVEHEATVERVISGFNNLVSSSSIGDVALLYMSTHGTDRGGHGAICLFDEDYPESDFSNVVDSLHDKQCALIAVFSACESEGMLKRSGTDVAIIAAAATGHYANWVFDEFLIRYGWEGEWCAKDGSITFLDLAEYATSNYNKLYSGFTFVDTEDDEMSFLLPSKGVFDNSSLLEKIVAANDASRPAGDFGSSVANLNASKGGIANSAQITISWDAVQGADNYFVFAGNIPGKYYCFEDNTASTSYDLYISDDESLQSELVRSSNRLNPVYVEVRAVGGGGVAFSTTDKGWKYETRTVTANAAPGGISHWGITAHLSESIVSRPIEYGSSLMELPSAKRDGFTVESWLDTEGNPVSLPLEITKNVTITAKWTAMDEDWLKSHKSIHDASGGDIATAASMKSANGRLTVGDCFALGVDPTDASDDLKITRFELKDGKPEISLNHNEDGAGKSFASRVHILGKKELDGEWESIDAPGAKEHRFFTVGVDGP